MTDKFKKKQQINNYFACVKLACPKYRMPTLIYNFLPKKKMTECSSNIQQII